MIKKKMVQEAFGDMRNMVDVKDREDIEVMDVIPSPQVFGYRNKIEFSFGKYISLRDGVHADWQLGFHRQGEFSKILDIGKCYLVSERVDVVFQELKKLCKQSGLPTYDHKTHIGFFRHMVIRE